MKRFFTALTSQRAQAAIEMAVFGSIIIFLIGAIVQQGASSAHQQNQQLHALRVALLKSENSASSGSLARSSGSFTLVEDRLQENVGKYGAMDRQVYIASGSGVMTDLLFRPVDWSDLPRDIPVMDLTVNGQDFVLRQAAKVTYSITISGGVATISAGGVVQQSSPGGHPDTCRLAREGFKGYLSVVSNGDDFVRAGNSSHSYDLKRDDGGEDPGIGIIKQYVSWQWYIKDFGTLRGEINAEDGSYPTADIDGDLSEETIYGMSHSGNTWTVSVLDYNAGDVDGSADWRQYANEADVPGLKSDIKMFTNPDGPGTNYLEIREDGVFSPASGVKVKSRSRKDQLDLISREYVLSPRMIKGGSLCSDSNAPLQSSVEVCCNGEGCCDGANMSRTCVQWSSGYGRKVLFIRSRVRDRREHRWSTIVKPDNVGDQGMFR